MFCLAQPRLRIARSPVKARWGVLLAIPLLMLSAQHAQAGGREIRERSARKACLSGDFAKGIEILSDLFIDTKDPTYIFNQARCFEQNNRYEEAVARFREYLRKSEGISASDRADTEKHIADCEALARANSSPSFDAGRQGMAGAATSPFAPATANPPPTVPVSVASSPSPATTTTTGLSPSNPGRGLRIAGIAFGVVGLASVAAAVTFYTRARYYSDKVSKAPRPNPADEDAGKQAEVLQWVFYSVGGAALTTGTALYVVGARASSGSSGTASILPMVGPGMAGLSAQGAF
jgi:hypothetical protein